LWFVSPQPQPGRVPDAPVVLSLGAAAGALTVTSFSSFSVASVDRSRSVIASFAVAIPFADFSRAVDEACSGSDTVGVVPVSSADTAALVARDALASLVDAPATCARSTMTAKTAAISQIPRWFMRAAPLQPKVGLR